MKACMRWCGDPPVTSQCWSYWALETQVILHYSILLVSLVFHNDRYILFTTEAEVHLVNYSKHLNMPLACLPLRQKWEGWWSLPRASARKSLHCIQMTLPIWIQWWELQIPMAVIKGKLLGLSPLRAFGGSASILQAGQAPVRTE